MKKAVLLLIPLMILSCKKEAPVSETTNKDSVIVSEQPAQNSGFDSVDQGHRDSVINNAPATKEVLRTGVAREEKDRVIVRLADGERLPFTIGEEFTEKHDKLILKISNFSKPKITAKISTKQQDFNIRFNQIQLPDGKMDGPFSREITYDVPKSGEVWLIIGKNLMADGKTTGSFSVSVE
ncbi:hypothetical protein NZ698_18340 [Chryseobacterium sp. PBS4-4]|uniref:DUF4625 domain-containing protein n=1 Tax=Chryseobacterium edaphi TaxID=2976532 RepID=A0ABT2WAB3_9FLAO|nr:hypothetical protein [Chryseobacterium edaphi]MCU7619143.1 hypothetical protein [Chryseobacterium edaphi]